MSSLDADDRLLLASAHPVLSPSRERELRSRLAEGANWPALAARAQDLGVAPTLFANLRALGGASMPGDVADALGASARACVAFNLALRHELGRVLCAFARAGLAVMPLKGPVLADELYPAPLLRPSADLDLLVRAGDCVAAARVLTDLGYVRRPDDEQGAAYHAIFTGRGVDLELHHDLGEAHVSRLDVEAIWRAAVSTRWQDAPVQRMATPHHLMYLAFHAAKDGLASLKALVDIALLVERHARALPWPVVATEARAAHVGPVVYLALREARALLGAPVPRDFLEAIRPRSPAWVLADRLFRWRGGVLHVPDDLLLGPFMAVLMLLWEDTPRARLRHLRRNVLPSASLRGRWTPSTAQASWLRWYPLWMAHAARQLLQQLAARPVGRVTRG